MKVNQRNPLKLWLQWIAANALGELLSLGTVGLIGFVIASQWEASVSRVAIVSFSLLMIVLGAFEGLVIGWTQ